MPSTDQLAKTPLHDWHADHGARMVDFAGWSMPVQYTSIVEEHKATREALGLFDISHMGRILFDGPDVAPFLDRLCTRSVADMKPQQIRYSVMCNEAGGVLDDVLVYRPVLREEEPAGFGLVVNASNREKLSAWLNSQVGDFDVQDQRQDGRVLDDRGAGPQGHRSARSADRRRADLDALLHWTAHASHRR